MLAKAHRLVEKKLKDSSQFSNNILKRIIKLIIKNKKGKQENPKKQE
jgi:hypothetical protein